MAAGEGREGGGVGEAGASAGETGKKINWCSTFEFWNWVGLLEVLPGDLLDQGMDYICIQILE